MDPGIYVMTSRFLKIPQIQYVPISRTAAITFVYDYIKKVSMFFNGKFHLPPRIIGVGGDNEKLGGRGSDIRRAGCEHSVSVERIYHNASEYLSWEEMRNGEGFN